MHRVAAQALSLCHSIAVVRNLSHLYHRQLVNRRQLVRQHFLKAVSGLNRLRYIQAHRRDVRPTLKQESTD